MPYIEFLQWQMFYDQHPFDDFHRFKKPAALLAAAFSGGDMSKYLDILDSRQPKPATQGSIDQSILAAFGAPDV